jgi:HlyD family secretion protein
MISEPIEPPIKQRQKKKVRFNAWGKWLVFLSLLLLGGGAGFFVYQQTVVQPRQQAKRDRQTVAIARENLTVTVTANGTVQPEMSINLSPKTSGVLRQLLVKEGNTIKAGQVLAKMDDSNLQGQLLQAKGQLAQAEANLQKLIAGNRPQDIAQAQAQLTEAQANLQKVKTGNRPQDIAQAQARLQNAQSQLRQTESTFKQNDRLYKQGAISERDWIDSQSQRDRANSQVLESQKALELQKAGSRQEDILSSQAAVQQKQQALSLAQAGSRIEDIAEARAQVITARGSLTTIQTQVNDTLIRAPFDGVVTRKFADPGAFVTPTTAGSAVSSATSSSILSLASANQIVVNVAESNISQMKLEQKATITADAYPGKNFAGKVTQISPQSIVQQNVTSFEVKVAILDDREQLLRSGMNVNVTFDAGTLANVLVVPTVAIARQPEGTGVYIRGENNRAEFVQITTGLTVNEKTEVRSGLQGNERIYVTFPEGKRPRSRIPGGSPGVPGLGGR